MLHLREGEGEGADYYDEVLNPAGSVLFYLLLGGWVNGFMLFGVSEQVAVWFLRVVDHCVLLLYLCFLFILTLGSSYLGFPLSLLLFSIARNFFIYS